MDSYLPQGLGWHQDIPDFRDYSPQSPRIVEWLSLLKQSTAPPPAKKDLRDFFSEVKRQSDLVSSSAHACVALVEFYNVRSFGKSLEPSVLFLHQAAARLGRPMGLSGTDLRSHLKGMVTFGIPPDSLWPNEPENVGKSPDALLCSFGDPYRSIRYARLDARNRCGAKTLETVKAFLTAGFPSVFGFSVPSCLSRECEIPYRPTFAFLRGGQAVVAVGYDNNRVILGTRGALLVRSSWGRDWGEGGYGWLPYAYVKEQLASSFWVLLHKEWLESGEFQRPELIS